MYPSAHVSGVIRLYDQRVSLLIEKTISSRVGSLAEVTDRPVQERLLNVAIEEFVRKLVTDPDVTQCLVARRD